MKEKFRLKGIWLVLAIIVGAIIVLWFIKAPIMSSYLSKKIKVKVSIAQITMRPTYTKLYRFHISNPWHSKTRTAFSAKKVRLDYKFKELVSDPTVIDYIQLDDVFLGIEFYNPVGTQNNWTAIAAKSKKNSEKSKGEYFIRKLVINNMDVEIYGMGLKGILGGTEKKHINRLEFNNINSKDGFPTDQLIQAIFGSTGLQKYIQNILSPRGLLRDVFSPFRTSEAVEEEKAPPEKRDASEVVSNP